MTPSPAPLKPNPFPGFRPFDASEAHLFFGRESQIDALIGRMQRNRFLIVLGGAGSGKSSLVRAGLQAALKIGMMPGEGTRWYFADLRPGVDPIGNLARALDQTWGGQGGGLEAPVRQAMLAAVLRRSAMGLRDAVRQARLLEGDRVLVLADQFEDLFRFKQAVGSPAGYADDAAAFVNLLLEAAREDDPRIYVLITLRSEFLGDCAEFRDLPEAINEGQYLIPRLTREERRAAIEAPVEVAGGEVARRLTQRLLNDVGDDPEQLPVLQHALMRTWAHWQDHRDGDAKIDLPNYEAIGTLEYALSNHANQAFDELSEPERNAAERMFRCLTERGLDRRQIRRPRNRKALLEEAKVSEETAGRVIEAFSREGRAFLVLPEGHDGFIDISYESLIRKWDKLREWVDREARSREQLAELDHAAKRHNTTPGRSLLAGHDLREALEWRKKEMPNPAWARLYGADLDLIDGFLNNSERRARYVRLGIVTGTLAVSILVATFGVREYRASVLRAELFEQTFGEFSKTLPEKLGQQEESLRATKIVYETLYEILLPLIETKKVPMASVDPAAAAIALGAGDAENALGHIDQAMGWYSKIIERDKVMSVRERESGTWPWYLGSAYLGLGWTNLKKGDPGESKRAYEESIRISQERLAKGTNSKDFEDLFADRLARGLSGLGEVQLAQLELPKALEAFGKAHRYREARLTRGADDATRQEFAATYTSLADVYEEQGLIERALSQACEARKLVSESKGRDDDAGIQLQIIRAKERVAKLLSLQARDRQAEEELQEAIRIADMQANKESADIELRTNKAILEHDHADILRARGEHESAIKLYDLSCWSFDALAEQDTANFESRLIAAGCRLEMADSFHALRKRTDAEARYLDTSRRLREFVDADKGRVVSARRLAESLQRLGEARLSWKELTPAEAHFREAHDLLKKLQFPDGRSEGKVTVEFADALSGWGRSLLEQGKFEEALPHLNDAANLYGRQAARDASHVEWRRRHAEALDALAQVLEKTGKATEADVHRKKAAEIRAAPAMATRANC